MQFETVNDLRALAKRVRLEKNMTQSDVAALLGNSTKWISDFETGKVSPPVDMVFNLLNLLGVKLHAVSPNELVPTAPLIAEEDEEIDVDMGLDARW